MSIRERLRRPAPLLNLFLTDPNPRLAEWLCAHHCESLTLDLQHGTIEDGDLPGLLQAVTAGGGVSAVRLAWNHPDRIMKALDLGANVLICPMIDGPEDAAAFVRAAKYPPLGNRSFGPVRTGSKSPADYFATANDDTLCFAMVETAGAIAHLAAIAATPGLDGLYVGPFDLSVATGLEQRADFSDPALLAMIDEVLAACRENNLFTGVFTVAAADAKAMIEKGFDFVTCGTDGTIFNYGMQSWSGLT